MIELAAIPPEWQYFAGPWLDGPVHRKAVNPYILIVKIYP